MRLQLRSPVCTGEATCLLLRCFHLNGQSGLTAIPSVREFPLTPPGVLAQYGESKPRHRIVKIKMVLRKKKWSLQFETDTCRQSITSNRITQL